MLYSKINMVNCLGLCFTLSSVRGHVTPIGWGSPKWPCRTIPRRSVGWTSPFSVGLRRERESGEAKQPPNAMQQRSWPSLHSERTGTKANRAPDTGTYPDKIALDLSDSDGVDLVASLGLSHIVRPNQLVGRLTHYLSNWLLLTSDQQILDVAKALRIDWVTKPNKSFHTHTHTKVLSESTTRDIPGGG